VNFGLGSKGSPPNQRLLLPGPAASTFGLVAEAGASDTPQQKRDPLGVEDLKECEGVA